MESDRILRGRAGHRHFKTMEDVKGGRLRAQTMTGRFTEFGLQRVSRAASGRPGPVADGEGLGQVVVMAYVVIRDKR